MSFSSNIPHSEDTWSIRFDGYDPQDEGRREALCALGNGYFVTRAVPPDATFVLSEQYADHIHYPGTYRAGLYNRLVSHVNGERVEDESIVNLPNWLPLTFRISDGDWFSIDQVEILAYRQTLHLRSGILQRQIQFRDPQGRQTTLHEQRLVSMAQPHLAALRLEVTAENWSGNLDIRVAIDGRVNNNHIKRYEPYNKQHLEPIKTEALKPSGIWLAMRTNQSRIEVTLAAQTRILLNGTPVDSEWVTDQETAYIREQTQISVDRGATVAIEKIVALYTSYDPAILGCVEAAQQAVQDAPNFAELLRDHQQTWERLWMRCDIEFEPLEYLRVTRLHLFHLLQTISPHTADLDTGIPSRGWHGEDYRGHIFWDEAFVLPFLIYRFPSIARSMLLYRYRRLNAARDLARQHGYQGAMFPWRSASSGGEETPRFQLNLFSGHWLPDHTWLQHHISAIIAHTIWQYYTITDDIVFLCDHGTEMLVEIARFWASLATYHAEDDRYEIRGVMGPDEYHTAYPDATTLGINNNTYTNVMAVWTLCRTQDALNLLPTSRRSELEQALNLSQDEIALWDTISHKMRVVFYENGCLSQYEGFDRLQPLDWQQFDEERINWVLEAKGDDINRYQLAKQADVAMLFFLLSTTEIESLLKRLGYEIDRSQMQRTIEYHLQRTSHESSLSHLIYTGALAQLNDEESWKLFTEVIFTDLSGDSSDEVKNGIHLGAMAGTLYILQHHYLGLWINRGKIYLNPAFPSQLTCLRVSLQHQYNDLLIEKTNHHLLLTAANTNPSSLAIVYQGEAIDLQPGDSLSFVLSTLSRSTLEKALP
jgi:trehalose/maltose hydrolase-like predicted phosphorylase